MKNVINNLKNGYHYSIESIKNRYPCKIIEIDYSETSPCIITYRCATRLNVRKNTLEEILNDKSLVEKFHPSDCVKFGFISAGDILFKNEYGDNKEKYLSILEQMIAN